MLRSYSPIPSCPPPGRSARGLCRASTPSPRQDVDGRDKPGHDVHVLAPRHASQASRYHGALTENTALKSAGASTRDRLILSMLSLAIMSGIALALFT